jgi:23S rRNA (pseudouridine1915-N3)-methyltransferase
MRLQEFQLEAEAFSISAKLAAQKKEADRLEKFLLKYDKADVILLDEGSEELDSLGFAKRLESYDGRKLIIVVGAALGFAKELKSRYRCLSLSKLTMPHELARLVLFEQLYRAATIIKGKEYHY